MIVSNKHPAIAKEGWLTIAMCFVAVVVSFFLYPPLAVIILFFLVSLVYLYRDPSRVIPSAPLGMVSPVDGRILSIERVDNHYSQEASHKITIKKNKTGVFAIRSPIEGKLLKQMHETVAGVSRYINWVQTDEGDNVLWDAEVSGRTHAYCYVQPGERIGHGQRCGFLLLKPLVNLYIPINSSLDVKVDDCVLAGETIIAHLVHNQGASIVSHSKGMQNEPKQR